MTPQDTLRLSPSRIGTNVTRAPETISGGTEVSPLIPDVTPGQMIPIWRDSTGAATSEQPENYNWFSAMSDRRLYAQTQGGAGYWIGGRTPARMFYEWSIGDFQGSEIDQEWVKNVENPEVVDKWLKTTRSNIGISEQLIVEDFGETALEDAFKSSVSFDNYNAKIQYMLDSAEAKRRIEEYDESSSWGGYIGTKVVSAIGNYMATDPPTTAITIATLGTGTLLPAAARSSFIATRLPWLSTPLQAARSFQVTHGVGLARANFAYGIIDGSLAGYAYHLGYNQDQSILYGNNALLDDNPLDDIALGGTLGLIGGFIGYRLGMNNITRQQAIESVAQSLGTIPHQHALDYATRYVTNHGQLLRTARRAGVEVASPFYRNMQDINFLRNAGWRSPEEVNALARWIKDNRPTTAELEKVINSKLAREINGTVEYWKFIKDTTKNALASNPNLVKRVDGVVQIDFSGNESFFLQQLREGTEDVLGTNARLRAALTATSDGAFERSEEAILDDIAEIYSFFTTRSGVTEYDLHQYIWSRSGDPLGLRQDLNLLLDFARRTGKEEIDIIEKHFPSIRGKTANKRVEQILGEIDTGQPVERIVPDADGMPSFESTGVVHILDETVELLPSSSWVRTDAAKVRRNIVEKFYDYLERGERKRKGLELTELDKKRDSIDRGLNERRVQIREMYEKGEISQERYQSLDAFASGLQTLLASRTKLVDDTVRYSERLDMDTISGSNDILGKLDILADALAEDKKVNDLFLKGIIDPSSLTNEELMFLRIRRMGRIEKIKYIAKEAIYTGIDKVYAELQKTQIDIENIFRKLVDPNAPMIQIIEGAREDVKNDIRLSMLGRQVKEIFDEITDDVEKFIEAERTTQRQRIYNRTQGVFSVEDAAKFAAGESAFDGRSVDRFNKAVSKWNDAVRIAGDFEAEFHANGANLEAGSPVARFETFINSNDDGLLRAHQQFLKTITEIAEESGGIPINPQFLERLELQLRQRLLKNDLLRQRLKNGMLAEQMGLLNARSSAIAQDARLIDGLLPFRSRTSVGLGESQPVLSRQTFADATDDLPDGANFWDEIEAQRISETIFDKHAADELNYNPRMNEDMQKYRNIRRQEAFDFNDPLATKFTRVRSEWERLVTEEDLLLTIRNAIPQGELVEGNRINILNILKATNGEIAKDGSLIVDGESIGRIPTGLFDDAGDMLVDDLNKAVKNAATSIENQQQKLYELVGDGVINQKQYDNIVKAMGGDVEGGWSFATANAAIVGLRQIPMLSSLATLGEKILLLSMDVQGESASKLWFNKTSRQVKGMNVMEQVLMFSNLIDSPHVLKRDFGNIVDMNLFSAQAIRNNNARQANKVIKRYKRLHEKHKITAFENEVAIDIMIYNDGSLLSKVDPSRQHIILELTDMVNEFFKGFADDTSSIVGSNMTPAAILQILKDNAIRFNTPAILNNRNAIRAAVRSNLTRYLNESVDELSNPNVSAVLAWSNSFKSSGVSRLPTIADADNAILNARTASDLMGLFQDQGRMQNISYRFFELLSEVTDAEVLAMRNVGDLQSTLRSHMGNTTMRQVFADTEESLLELMDRSRRFANAKNDKFNVSPQSMAGIRLWDKDGTRTFMRRLMVEPDMLRYQIRSIPELIVEYANNDGLNLRMQAQVSREFGGVNIFQILENTRQTIVEGARAAERAGYMGNAMKSANETMDALEKRMAHALGFDGSGAGYEARKGLGEATFRLQNGMIRASLGAFWGLQTAVAEIPKAMLLGWNRNGTINMIIDLVSAIKNKADLDDIGFAIEQYTQRYALGVDNEAYAGSVQLNRVPLIGKTTGININPARPIKRTFDILTGTQTDPAGAAVTMGERGNIARGIGRGVDAAVSLTESLANTNSRIGGMQYFVAMGRDIAVRSGKRQIVNNIDRLIAFSRDFSKANFDQIPNFNDRLAAFKKLAKKHKLNWDFVVRMNHNGLLDEGDLLILKQAFKNKKVVPKGPKVAGVTLQEGNSPYILQELLDEIDNISTASMIANRRDDIAAKLSSFLDEEANTALNAASLVGANPDASLPMRWLFQFSNYARGFQHQSVLRGMNDSNMSKMLSMIIPVLIGEMVYTNVRNMMLGKARGQKTFEQSKEEFIGKLRSNPELVVYESISRMPIGGGVQSMFMNSVVNPLANNTATGRDTMNYAMDKGHDAIFQGMGLAVNAANTIGEAYTGESSEFENPILPSRNPNLVYLPEYSPLSFRPFTDGYKFVEELVTENPYMNKREEYLGIGAGRAWSMVPGYRTWQFQSALRLMGYEGYSPDPRARKFQKK